MEKVIDYGTFSQYFCTKCKVMRNTPPKVEIDGRMIDNINLTVVYRCGDCNNPVAVDYFKPEDIYRLNIPEEAIIYDQTGDYKKPTPESIDSLLNEAEKCALKVFNPEDRIKIAEIWAQKISFPINEDRLKSIKSKYETAYNKSREDGLENLVFNIKNLAYNFNNSMCTDELSHYIGSGLSEYMSDFFEALKLFDDGKINIEKLELKQDILEILKLHKEMTDEEIKELEEKKEDLEKRINNEKANSKKKGKRIQHYIDQANLSNDEVSEADKRYFRTDVFGPQISKEGKLVEVDF